MATMTSAKYGPNIPLFLDLLAFSEGTSKASGSPSGLYSLADGYDLVVAGPDGPERFSNGYVDHPFKYPATRPPKLVRPGLYSTASGRYQVLLHFFEAYKIQLSLPDFSPLAQDEVAVQMMHECGAIVPLQNGAVQQAIMACNSRWASLPGNTDGQGGRSMQVLLAQWSTLGMRAAITK
jgi:muramidase (phage lysozyme)